MHCKLTKVSEAAQTFIILAICALTLIPSIISITKGVFVPINQMQHLDKIAELAKIILSPFIQLIFFNNLKSKIFRFLVCICSIAIVLRFLDIGDLEILLQVERNWSRTTQGQIWANISPILFIYFFNFNSAFWSLNFQFLCPEGWSFNLKSMLCNII